MTVFTNYSFHNGKPINNLSFGLPSRRGVKSMKETIIMKLLNSKTYCSRTLLCFPRVEIIGFLIASARSCYTCVNSAVNGKKYAEVIKLRIASAHIGPSRGEILNKLVQESVVVIGLPVFSLQHPKLILFSSFPVT